VVQLIKSDACEYGIQTLPLLWYTDEVTRFLKLKQKFFPQKCARCGAKKNIFSIFYYIQKSDEFEHKLFQIL